MQYIISQHTIEGNNNWFATTIYKDNKAAFEAYGDSKKESRLKAIKLAMLLAINESEKMMNGKID